MTRVTIEVTEEEKQKLKILAAVSKLSIKDFILERTIKETKKPNKKTMQAFEDVKNGKDLTKHTNFNTFLKDLTGH